MKVLILAGGAGTRLRSVVADRPKPMADVDGKPFLEHQLEFLKSYDLHDFVLCVGYRSGDIVDYFGDGRRWGISVEYSVEQTPLGTGGALKNAERFLDEPFLLLNGDSFFDIDVRDLVRFHRDKRAENDHALGTLALTSVPDSRSYGSVHLDESRRIVAFKEKCADVQAAPVSAGIYVLEPEILDFLPAAQPVSLERDALPSVLAHGHSLFGHHTQGFFVDIGTPDGYLTFRNFIAGRKP